MVTEKALLNHWWGSIPPLRMVCWTVLGGVGVGGLDSHFRYLPGLRLGIGVSFMWAIAHIEL
jgi:hypothetical protein